MNFQILQECKTNFKRINLNDIINKSLDFVKMTSKNKINLISKKKLTLSKAMRIN